MSLEIVENLAIVRMDHDFTSELQVLWPDDDQDVWKTEILDSAFDIMMASCPDRIVPSLYLQMIREYFVYHLNEVWKREKTFKPTRSEFQSLADQLDSCFHFISSNFNGNISQVGAK